MSSDLLKTQPTLHGPEARVTLSGLAIFGIAFALAAAMTGLCLCVASPSLALFLYGHFTIAAMLPAMVLARNTPFSRLFISGCVVDGVGAIWLFAATSPQISFMHWLRCYLVLIAFATLVSGLSVSLLRLRIAPVAASAIAVMLSLIWLTAPVWLASNLSTAGAARLVGIHPVFAINRVLAHLGTWTHMPLAYRSLTTLGQDIPYSLPARIWPCVLVHLIPGIGLWWVGSWRAAAQPSEASPSSAEARS